MHRVQVLLCLILIGGDKLATSNTAFAGTSFARLLVLLQTCANHLGITVATLHTNVVHVTGDEAALATDERLLSAQRTEHEVRNALRAKHATACDAFARAGTEFAAKGALEFVDQLLISNVLLSLNSKIISY